jgi:D-threonate/D-erythronate kinase
VKPQRCLIIADDLTGGADAGAQFAKRGLDTLLVSFRDRAGIDFFQYAGRDVLVVNTDTRKLDAVKAARVVSNLFRGFDTGLFPIVYKKIDSTLRGNIGSELDAILEKTKIPLCFLTPAYPEQHRTLVGGILTVRGLPLSSTEMAPDVALPAGEFSVHSLLRGQTVHHIASIDLARLAATTQQLAETVVQERIKGNRVILFDAVSRQDLTKIVEAGFAMDEIPLFAGSAGLAGEVAKKLSPAVPRRQRGRKFKHIFVISGSLSSVTQQQLRRLRDMAIPAVQLSVESLTGDKRQREIEGKRLRELISQSLSVGPAILETYPGRLPSHTSDTEIRSKISETLAQMAFSAVQTSNIRARDLALILTGGDTALSVINVFKAEGIEMEGELLEGMMLGHVMGGTWNGLTVITKAGAFGDDQALQSIIERLENKWLSVDN